ncbi:MAG: BrnA antitoxin family protein [Alphaproteobacteria bacterium]|jgi:uncharacterized protein (DUF4415 family)|nr:BrnA antitoxin family protein [Alphaproteobacteria bacterium]
MATKPEAKFEPGHGYSRQDWDDVDSPELTGEELASMRPAREMLPPEFFETIDRERRKRGRPASVAPKRQVTLRIDADVIESFRAEGTGWQSRINEALRKARGL